VAATRSNRKYGHKSRESHDGIKYNDAESEAFLKRGYSVVANSPTITKANPFPASANLALVDGDIGEPKAAAKIVDTAISLFGNPSFTGSWKGCRYKLSSSDHSCSALASSFACTLAHSRPLRRFMFFSKRAFNAPSNSSRCSGDKPFLLLLMSQAFIALIVARVSYLLLRRAPPHGFFGLSLRSYQFAVSTPFGVHPSVHPRSPPGEYVCVPFFPTRQGLAGKSRGPPPQMLPAAPA
jgi:hypothetical protein